MDQVRIPHHNRNNARKMKGMGLIWATFVTLPFLETLVFNAHVSSGRSHLSTDDYIRVSLLGLLLWASMCLVFLIEREHIDKLSQQVRETLSSFRRGLRKHAKTYIYLAAAMVLIYVFMGRQRFVEFVEGEALSDFLKLLIIVSVGLLIWFLARFIQSLGSSLPAGLRQGVDSWALSFRVAIPFYLLLIGGTWIWVNFTGISSVTRLDLQLSLVKDYILLFIISGMLYVGLFKLARARALLTVFQNVRGFLHFVIVCGIIAILAIWADFRTVDPIRLGTMFSTRWQREYMTVHVFVRDIGLLLFPIAFLLFWTVKCVAQEGMKQQPSAPAKASKSG